MNLQHIGYDLKTFELTTVVSLISQPKAICLNMIVKNEVVNLERCLSSVADHISCWVIGDTGSTDGTQELIERFFAARGIPGELHRFPFENFAQARNEALDRARASGLHFDYLLLTDADMELRVQNPAFSNNLEAAAYKVLQNSGVAYWNNRLLRRDVPASYRGVTHEYLDVRAGETRSLDGIRFIDHATGSNRVDKYERDARLLTDAIATERDPGMTARYTFYLANTLRDSGQKEAALEMYLNRARQGNWQQEVFMSLLNVAKLKEALKSSSDEVIAAYTEANAACPARAEGLHGAARYCRKKRLYEQGYKFAEQGLKVSYPTQALFVEDWIYAHGLLDELAIHAYWTERYVECVDACERLLSERKLPTDQRDRVLKNRNFAVGKLGEVAAPSSREADIFIKLLRAARRKEELGCPDEEVISAYIEATAACPTRAEALHGAARYCRVKGMHERGYEFAAQGLAIAYPKDALAVEHWIYEYGLQQEFSIVANYSRDPARKDRGFASCNWLALNRTVPEDPRNLALSNLHFYVEPAAKMMPSFAARPVGFAPPDGYRPTNPSIACHGDEIVLVQRAVNYTIDLAMADGDDRRYATPDGAPINTRNFLLRMDDDLAIRSSTEILPPEGMPKPVWPLTQGFEDLRPFVWRDELWCIAGVRELSHEGWYEQVLARIDERTPGGSRLADWRVLRPAGPRRHEKNWMPRVAGDTLHFIYLCDPTRLVDDQVRTVAETIAPIMAEQFRGGSQAIAFDGGWLVLVHEARVREGQRQYRHRFVWFDDTSKLRRVSRPFFFCKHGVEFAAGLAWHPDGKRLVVTYGVDDAEAWIATVESDDIRHVLQDAERPPSGAPEAEHRVASIMVTDRDVAASATATEGPSSTQITPPIIFIHSAPRTSSTWFWNKFRGSPSTLCYYEPFNEEVAWITRAEASVIGGASWDSRHPPTDPYYLEYIPLISETGGIQLFDPAMTIQWFIPLGGLRGELRPSEKDYLLLLIRHADQAGKLPVFGCPRTLGRLWAIKNTFGGFHVFVYRNLWKQWLSFLYYKRRGDHTFINVVLDTVNRTDDRFFSYLIDHYRKHARKSQADNQDTGTSHTPMRRKYMNLPGDRVTIDRLESLHEHDIFGIFMALQIYLYLHAQLSADLTVDVTRMTRENNYRFEIERTVEQHTGIALSFADVADVSLPGRVDVDIEAINWDEIKGHVRVAVRILTEFGDPEKLAATATEFMDATLTEMRRNEDSRTMSRAKIKGAAELLEEKFLSLAPFLRSAHSPNDRQNLSHAFDARIASFLSDRDVAALPQIHCFYEVMSETAKHVSLIAAIQSMRAVGHSVRVWSYAPAKLEFLKRNTGSICVTPPMSSRRASSSISSPVRKFDIFQRHLSLCRALRAWRACGWTLTW